MGCFCSFFEYILKTRALASDWGQCIYLSEFINSKRNNADVYEQQKYKSEQSSLRICLCWVERSLHINSQMSLSAPCTFWQIWIISNNTFVAIIHIEGGGLNAHRSPVGQIGGTSHKQLLGLNPGSLTLMSCCAEHFLIWMWAVWLIGWWVISIHMLAVGVHVAQREGGRQLSNINTQANSTIRAKSTSSLLTPSCCPHQERL